MLQLFNRIKAWLRTPQLHPPVIASAARQSMPLADDAHAHLVPFDENLLERSRTQWQFGDWASLANLGRDILQHHPDRAKLALLAAAGHQGLGNAADARQLTRLAIDWGCSKKLVTQILISGVHNTLGRAAALSGLVNRSQHHFESAISLDKSGADQRLLSQARIAGQFNQLGLSNGSNLEKKISHETNIVSKYFGFEDGSNSCLSASNLSINENISTLDDLKSCIWIKEIEASKHALLSRRKLVSKFVASKSHPIKNLMVSILLPTMRPSNIEIIIKNIALQSYENIELILIPQFYSDSQVDYVTEKITDSCSNLKNLVVLRLADDIPLGARLNKAIEVSAGSYWAKMDDDDLYFPNYLSDMLLPFCLDDYAVTGKSEQFIYLSEINKMLLKNPGGRDRISFISGATFVVNKTVAGSLRFGESSSGEDTYLINMAKEKKMKIYAADPFNHIVIRSKSLDDHTWKFSTDAFLQKGVIVGNEMCLELVVV